MVSWVEGRNSKLDHFHPRTPHLRLFFANEEHACEAVSSGKSFSDGFYGEGQRIYQVTKENVSAMLPVLNRVVLKLKKAILL